MLAKLGWRRVGGGVKQDGGGGGGRRRGRAIFLLLLLLLLLSDGLLTHGGKSISVLGVECAQSAPGAIHQCKIYRDYMCIIQGWSSFG